MTLTAAQREAWLRAAAPLAVVAPHPDDEVIGCGGLIAAAACAGVAVHLVLMTDGQASHPGSRRFSAAHRSRVRRAEWQAAAAALGVATGSTSMLDLADGAVPQPGDDGFDDALQRLRATPLVQARTWFVPEAADRHRDHRATFALCAALAADRPVRCLAYEVWPPDAATAGDDAGSVAFDVSDQGHRVAAALQAHASQLGRVFVDDPAGFTLPAWLQARALTGLACYRRVPLGIDAGTGR